MCFEFLLQVFDNLMFYFSTPFIYVTTLLIHIIYCELEREMLFIMTTPQFIFDFYIIHYITKFT